MFPRLFNKILNCFRPRKGGWRAPPPRRRAGRVALFQPLENLEERQLLTASAFESLNQGVSGYDSTSGEWITLRYDGEKYVQENAVDLNAVGRFSDPLAVDFDGDGMDEIYLRDNKTGNWWTINPASSSNQLRYIAYWGTSSPIVTSLIGDIDGDGRKEIITMSSQAQWVSLGYDGADFKTTELPSWESYRTWTDFLLADTNGDGIDEIFARDTSSGYWRTSSKVGNSFSTSIVAQWVQAATYRSPMVGDMNGDGREEIIAYDNFGKFWNVAYDGTKFSTQLLRGWDTSGNWREFVIADINGDGKDEVIGHQTSTGKWWGLFSDGTGYLSRQLGLSSTTLTFEYMLVGDVTGDGRDDVVSRDSLGNFYALTSDGTTSQLQLIKNWTTSVEWRNIMLFDYDGDGVQEIVGRNAGNGYWWGIDKVTGGYANRLIAQWGTTADYLYVFSGKFRSGNGAGLVTWDARGDWWYSPLNGSSVNTWITNQEPPVRYTQTWVADINGDGTQDLIGYDASRGNWWGLIHDSSGTHNTFLGQWNVKTSWQNIQFVDFNGDGSKDIAGWDPAGGNWFGIVSKNGTHSALKLTNWAPTSTYRNVMVIDMNGDGRQEIVGRNQTGGWWAISFDGSTYRSQYLKGWTESMDWRNIAVVDLEGDGRQEIIAQSALKGEWWELYDTGAGSTFRKVASWNPSETYGNLLIGDINGDGKSDIAAQSNRGAWWMLTTTGTSYATRFITGWNAASPWQNFVIADLGGDGKAEIIAQDSGTGAWWGIFADGMGFDSHLLIAGSENLRTNGLQVADINHDGAADLIGRDPTTNQWWSLSTTGTTSTVQNLGTANLSNVTVGAIPGVSDSSFKQWLLRSIPNLAETLATDRLLAARMLLNWASNNADGALTSSLEGRTNQQTSIYSRPSDLFKDFFDPDLGGFYCGGYSIFFNNILHLFGYDSFTFNFGDIRDDLTHVTVVVPIANGANDWNYYILDPTFNSIFSSTGSTRQLTVQEMLQKYYTGQTNQIVEVNDSIADREWLAIGTTDLPQFVHQSGVQSVDPSIEIYTRPTYTISIWTNEIRNNLMKYGYSTGTTAYMELMTKNVFNVGDSTNAAARDRFIYHLKAYGIPV